MATLNANQLIIDAINAGSLSNEEANKIIRGAGFTDQFGEGRATNFFNTNQQANTSVLNQLQNRGLIPPQSLNEYLATSVNNPVLPSTTELIPQVQSVQQGELQATPQPITPPSISAPATVTAPQVKSAQASLDDLMVSYEDALKQIQQGSGQYAATTVAGQTPQAVAAKGDVSELATVQGQLAKLYSESADGQVPIWAQGAVRKAEEVLAARKLGASNIAAGAITAAIQESAINIAAQDAQTYFQMDLTNLAAEQQTRLENVRIQQQSLLTDQAALNAAAQFNASSTQQIEMFQAGLVAQIKEQNANRVASMRQFNVVEQNKATLSEAQLQSATDFFNVQQKSAVDQFNATLKFQAQTFNANMAQVIDQSNVQWRRQINTANTATINAANQVNVQNRFNLSNYALNALWQQARDEADWLWQSTRDATEYQYKLGLAGTERDTNSFLQNQKYNLQQQLEYSQALGAAGKKILDRIL